jgi:hypothetical protein
MTTHRARRRTRAPCRARATGTSSTMTGPCWGAGGTLPRRIKWWRRRCSGKQRPLRRTRVCHRRMDGLVTCQCRSQFQVRGVWEGGTLWMGQAAQAAGLSWGLIPGARGYALRVDRCAEVIC